MNVKIYLITLTCNKHHGSTACKISKWFRKGGSIPPRLWISWDLIEKHLTAELMEALKPITLRDCLGDSMKFYCFNCLTKIYTLVAFATIIQSSLHAKLGSYHLIVNYITTKIWIWIASIISFVKCVQVVKVCCGRNVQHECILGWPEALLSIMGRSNWTQWLLLMRCPWCDLYTLQGNCMGVWKRNIWLLFGLSLFCRCKVCSKMWHLTCFTCNTLLLFIVVIILLAGFVDSSGWSWW